MAEETGIKLLLISDLHCIGGVWPAFNWITGDTRRSEKALELFHEVMDHYHAEADHVLIVGDLTDSGKDSQYRAVSAALQQYGPEKIAVIPGNHDLANFNIMRSWKNKMKIFKKNFGAYMNPHPEPVQSDDFFPYIKKLKDGFVMIAMETTVSGTAHGRLGDEQLERLESFFSSDEYAGMHRIILMHHDPIGKIKHYSGFDIPYGNVMEDAGDFLDLLKAYAGKSGHRDTTVIFGHTHNSSHSVEEIEDVNFVRVPSMGSIYGEDFLYIEIDAKGRVRNVVSELPGSAGIKIRRLKDMWKTLFPDKFE